MARRKRRVIGGLLGRLAVAVGLAAVVSNLEKEAKEEGKDITDVAAEKVNTFVDSVKSGELQKNVLEKADKVINGTKETINSAVESVKSGEIAEKADKVLNDTKETISNAVEAVKSGEIKDKATQAVDNLRDGVVDLFDGTGTNVPEEETEETSDDSEEV